jgi:F0F1-type ATP synthase membrane subunit b/b'
MGNGVTVKLREKAEKILLSKYNRLVKEARRRCDELKEEARKEVLAELGIDKLVGK